MNDIDLTALRASLQPLQHRRIGPGKCACGFDAYKIRGIMVDYSERMTAHLLDARRSPTYKPLSRDTALRLLDQLEQARTERDEARRDAAAARNTSMDADEEIEKLRADADLYRQYEEKYIGKLAAMGIESRKFGDEVNRLRDAIQRVREVIEPGSRSRDFYELARDVRVALDGEVPDGN